MGVSVEYRFEQRRADALPLFFGIHQNILHKHNGGTIAHHPHNAEQFPVFICRQNKQRIFVPALQCRHIFRIRGPANLRIQLQNFIGLRQAKVALTGAAPIAPDVVRFFRSIGVPLIEVYGLTESTGMVTGHRLDDVIVGTVGPVIDGVQYRIANPDDSGSGEFQIHGDMVFAGYYKNPEATAQTIQDGWLHTGDVVREVGGQIKIVDRLKDIMITAGGKNLTPSEIENTMKASPYIKECIVVADGRKYVAALVQIDMETVGKWAEARRLAFTHFRSLVEMPEVRQLVQDEIATGNAKLAQVSHIRKFHLLTKELDHDDGEVTATMKVRRSSIYKTYAAEIEALY